jgi:rhodanese-related sulfurtransferase
MLKYSSLASAIVGYALIAAPAWAFGESKACCLMKCKQAAARSFAGVGAVAEVPSVPGDAKPPAKAKPNARSETKAETKAETEAEPKAEAKAEAKAGENSEMNAESKPEAKAEAKPVVKVIKPADVPALIQSNKIDFIDVREKDEFAAGRPAGSRNLPLSEIETWAPTLDKNATYVMTCRSGRRSGKASERLLQLGVKQVSNMDGGFLAWEKAGLQVEK